LGKRGYDVTLAEAGTKLGGRVALESRLPGLSAWIRVKDYRELQLRQLPNVEIYFDSELTAAHILEFGIPRVVIATGSTWRSDGVGRHHLSPIPISGSAVVLSASDILEGRLPVGKRVLVWDDDHYYMGGVIAELLAERGFETIYATPASEASTWTRNTMEQHFIQKRMLEKNISIRSFRALDSIENEVATLSCTFTGRRETLDVDAVIMVTARTSKDQLAVDLRARRTDWQDAAIESVTVIGDALAPATIAHAVYAGRKFAEELDEPPHDGGSLPFRREIAELI
jgi:dimethylamine/trimethylamine dehydrogenase